MTGALEVFAPDGVGEVVDGEDLAALLLAHATLADGDIVAVTSKVVSKAEGRIRVGSRDDAVAGETVRVVARRGPTTIARTRLGLTLAAAGIDASNVKAGHHLLLPVDPDASARRIREAVLMRTGCNVAVLVTDTAGRPWREGQTDIAIGAAGLVVAEDFSGQDDGYGNPLMVTIPAVADELAGAAELASGKLGGRPFSVIRGRSDLVLAPGVPGTGAGALVRADGLDMFGYGSREAVLRALTGTGQAVFGAPADAAELTAALAELLGDAGEVVAAASAVDSLDVQLHATHEAQLLAVTTLAFAFGWSTSTQVDVPGVVRVRPACP